MIQIDMPMPDNCDECRFNTEYGFCKAMPDNFCGNTDNRKRPEWCPMREQEPKQVIRKQCKKEHDDGSIDYFAEWYCPHCNMLILRGFDNPSIKFCYKCGKPILWEGR